MIDGPCPTSGSSPRSSRPATSPRRSIASSTGSGAASSTRPCSARPAPARPSTIARTIEALREADAGPRPQQDARGAALQRVPRVLPGQRGRVLRQLLRLLPARGVPAAQRHVHREGLDPERRDRPAAPRGDPRPVRASRRDHRRVASRASTASARRSTTGRPSLRLRQGGSYRRDAVLRQLVDLQYQRNDQSLTRARFRVRGDTLEFQPASEEPHRPGRVLRRRGRADHRARPADRRAPRRAQGGQRLPGQPLRHAGRQDEARDRRHRGRDGGAGRRARGGGPGPRGRAAPAAHDVRPRDDARARLLHRASRTTRATSRGARPARDRGRCSTTSRRTGCSSSTSRT